MMPGEPQKSLLINLKVKSQNGNEVFFRLKRTTQLKKLMDAHCHRECMDFDSIAFMFNGRRLHPDQTPDELNMDDGYEIDALVHQTGGGGAVGGCSGAIKQDVGGI